MRITFEYHEALRVAHILETESAACMDHVKEMHEKRGEGKPLPEGITLASLAMTETHAKIIGKIAKRLKQAALRSDINKSHK